MIVVKSDMNVSYRLKMKSENENVYIMQLTNFLKNFYFCVSFQKCGDGWNIVSTCDVFSKFQLLPRRMQRA